VRATGSGAGCGSHWPLCNGEVIPRAPRIETIIEFSHRLSSGIAFLLVLGLFVWAFRIYPKGHSVRLGASISLLFIITEALVGAGLVLFEWVAQDASAGRVISMAVHLINTFLLLASLTLTSWWASGGSRLSLQGREGLLLVFCMGFVGVIFIGVSGAITALGDTLFPADSLIEGVRQDINPAAHFLIRLRVWHPIIAITVGLYLIFIAGLLAYLREDVLVKRFAGALIGLFILQLVAGLINLLLLAPVWMQLVHLLLADMVWITLVLFTATEFALSKLPSSALSIHGFLQSES
jgi:heme A synthase